jgi:nucleoid DNA-binding protein
MTKAELIARIARSRELPPDVTKKVIAKVLDLAFTELTAYFVRSRVTRSSSPRFTYPKFGTFTKKQRSGRRGVNPRTLEPIEIEACETVDFKPSIELKRMLNDAGTPVVSTGGRKKKAVRSSAKVERSKKSKSLSAAKQSLGGRTLLTRDEVELERSQAGSLLPDAPLQKLSSRPGSRADLSSRPGSRADLSSRSRADLQKAESTETGRKTARRR